MELWEIIWELDVRHKLLPNNLYATWVRFAQINITWDQLKHHPAEREQAIDEQLYCLKLESARLVNYRVVQTSFVAI